MILDPGGFSTFAEIDCVVDNEIGVSVDSHVISVDDYSLLKLRVVPSVA